MKSRSQTTLDLICEIADRRRLADDKLMADLQKALVATLSPETRASLRAHLESFE